MSVAYIQYKNASLNELSDLLMLEELCFGKKRSHRKFLKRYFQSQVARCLVAKLDDRVVGYVLTVFTPNMKTASVNAICVHPRLRQQGIGETLLHWAEVDAIQTGASQIGMEIQYENDIMRHILTENDYTESPDPLTLIPELSDGVKMRKRLGVNLDDSINLSNVSEVEMSAMNADHFKILAS